jgi:hypothetical protein
VTDQSNSEVKCAWIDQGAAAGCQVADGGGLAVMHHLATSSRDWLHEGQDSRCQEGPEFERSQILDEGGMDMTLTVSITVKGSLIGRMKPFLSVPSMLSLILPWLYPSRRHWMNYDLRGVVFYKSSDDEGTLYWNMLVTSETHPLPPLTKPSTRATQHKVGRRTSSQRTLSVAPPSSYHTAYTAYPFDQC